MLSPDNKAIHPSGLRVRFFSVVRFVYGFCFLNDYSGWYARLVISVVPPPENSKMKQTERLQATERLLRKRRWDADSARQAARDAVENGEPLLESLCFQQLAEHILATIHTSSWISNRAENPSSDAHDVINRLIDSGASPEDLAIFARMMQREYLSDLGCILDGAGIYGTPALPFEDFRVFSVDDSDQPQSALEELHESLGWVDLETEMRLSREAAKQGG